ncbi:MAG TPA: stage 0 sporulation family protein [Ktedonobacterales bacterium]
MICDTHVVNVVGVRFRPAGRIYYYDSAGHTLKTGTWVVVPTPKGQEAARVVIAPKDVDASELGSEGLKPVSRLASEDDLRQMLAFKAKEKDALVRCAQRIDEHRLPMKLVEAEYTYDGSRLTFYFAAEQRVDFRALVRDLASAFHTRIELRQISARDHAKLLSGVGPCGKTLCCSSWLTEFGVVSIKMAKEQGLPLNPGKISGVCGRLMCCLAYENDSYIEAKQEMPAYGEVVGTSSGPGRVVGINVPKMSVDVMLESGATIQSPVPEIDWKGRPSPPKAREHSCGGGNGNCERCRAKKAAADEAARGHTVD